MIGFPWNYITETQTDIRTDKHKSLSSLTFPEEQKEHGHQEKRVKRIRKLKQSVVQMAPDSLYEVYSTHLSMQKYKLNLDSIKTGYFQFWKGSDNQK